MDTLEERVTRLETELERLINFVGSTALIAGPRFLFVMNGLSDQQIDAMNELLEDFADLVDDGEPVDVSEFANRVAAIVPEVVATKPDFAGRVAAWSEADHAYKRLHTALVKGGLPGAEVQPPREAFELYWERRNNRLKRWDERSPRA